MKHILITGAKGQLGSEIQAIVKQNKAGFSHTEFYYTDKEELDITDFDAIKSFVVENTIDTIINCAAYTAVDKAEEDEEMATAINATATGYLAKVAKEYDMSFVHISTDYVFDGTNHTPYVEDDPTNPQGIYGKTKLEGDLALQKENPNKAIIIRTSWVYSSFGANFVKTILRLGKERDELGVIFDQVGSPTYAKDLAKAIFDILIEGIKPSNTVEIYHYSNEGACSWYDFAKAIFALSGVKCKVNPITTDMYPTPAKRPHYSLLNKGKIKQAYTVDVPYWKDSLKQCLSLIEEA